MPKESKWLWMRSGMAGLVSGFTIVLAGHPFDTLKVRLQVEGLGGRFRGPIDCLLQTVRKEGILALYKGVTPPFLMTGMINSAMWSMQADFSNRIKRDKTKPATVTETMAAAVLGGFLISFVAQPMEAVKARLQIQYHQSGPAIYKGPADCVRQIISKAGWLGLFRGWTLTALCRMSNYAYFGPYELTRRRLGMATGSAADCSIWRSLAAAVVCGSAAGVSYWTSCYPLDLIKNRIMTAPDTQPPIYRNGWHCARRIYAAQGVRGFFVGLSPCLLRAVPANAAAFAAYETVMHLLPN